MLANIKKHLKSQAGVTLTELIIAISIIGLLVVPTMVVMFQFYGGAFANNIQARLAVESQGILRSIVEELRVSSGIRASNTIVDANAPPGGWTTSNDSLVLIIATPVIDNSNEYVIDTDTGEPYQNELVYFATNGTLYKRYLAHPSATGNRFQTSCPAASATATCPSDVALTTNFEDMSFTFYDQDDAETTVHADARSIYMTIQMLQQAYGRTVTFQNNIRITLRNTL